MRAPDRVALVEAPNLGKVQACPNRKGLLMGSVRDFRSRRGLPWRCQASDMNIDAVIAALGGRFDADEAEVIERVLREYGGTVPDEQLISEAALAIHRRGKRRPG